MKKNRLHILTAFLSIVLPALFCINVNAFIPDEDDLTKTVDYVRYYMYESEGEKLATVYDFVDYDDLTELNILSEIDGYKVIEIEAVSEPGDFPKLKEVTIGENVERISMKAFRNLGSLKKVNLPSTLTYIGDNAFKNCSKLEAINLKHVTHIGTGAFENCTSLKEVTFSENEVTIGARAFENTGFETITIPSKAVLTSKDAEWSGYQFSNCLNLKTVIFEDRADSSKPFYIDEDAFFECKSLETVILPQNASNIIINNSAFLNCKNLKNFDFSNVTKIYDFAFKGCTKITKADFSDKLEVIGCHAFENTGLKKITIPSNTQFECYLSGEREHYDDTDAYADWFGQFKNCKNLKTVIFEDKTTSNFTIPHFTFEGCTALKKVYLPEDTKITVNPRAFKNCTSLTKVYGSENIVEIGDAAFSYCKSLKEITLGKNLKTVGEKAFLGCSKLARVNLESTKTAPTFGRKAFSATADGIKFVADKAIAKKVKTNLKNTATKNAKVYSVSYSKV